MVIMMETASKDADRTINKRWIRGRVFVCIKRIESSLAYELFENVKKLN